MTVSPGHIGIEKGQLMQAIEALEKAELEFHAAKNTCITTLEGFSVPSEQAQAFVKDRQSIRQAAGLAYRYPFGKCPTRVSRSGPQTWNIAKSLEHWDTISWKNRSSSRFFR